MGTVKPYKESLEKAFREAPEETPFVMLNLLKFRDTASYPDSNEEIPGRKAYNIYSKNAFSHVKKAGGNILWYGEVKAHIIGPEEGEWDQVLMVRYPSMEHFKRMISDKTYIEISRHREAALEDSRLIATFEVKEK